MFDEDFDFGLSDLLDDEELTLKRESEWSRGLHTTKDGDRLEIKEMTDNHLKNTINYFEDTHDVSSLVKEINRRKVLKLK